jgi:hypothetical protein
MSLTRPCTVTGSSSDHSPLCMCSVACALYGEYTPRGTSSGMLLCSTGWCVWMDRGKSNGSGCGEVMEEEDEEEEEVEEEEVE